MAIKFSQANPEKPKRAFDKIKEGLEEALAVAKGEAEPAAIHVRQGRPPSERPKKLLSIRLDQDVVEGFKATGEGWQSRINAILRKELGL